MVPRTLKTLCGGITRSTSFFRLFPVKSIGLSSNQSKHNWNLVQNLVQVHGTTLLAKGVVDKPVFDIQRSSSLTLQCAGSLPGNDGIL